MTVKLFVGNLSPLATNEGLEELFVNFGTVVECSVLGNFAFVHMEEESAAEAAIRDLNNYNFHGQPLSVEKAKNTSVFKKSARKIPERIGLTKIFVGNINESTTSEELRSLFQVYGEVAEADICGGFGFVHMPNQMEALKAIGELKGYVLNGSKLNIELSTANTQGRRRIYAEEMGNFNECYQNTLMGEYRGPIRGQGGGMKHEPYKLQAPPKKLCGVPVSGYYGAEGVGVPLYPIPPARGNMLGSPPSSIRTFPPAGDSFARELLDLYLRNPEAFDRYARDPIVQQSLNLNYYQTANSTIPPESQQQQPPPISQTNENLSFFKAPRSSEATLEPVMYPNLPSSGALKSGGGVVIEDVRTVRPPPPHPRYPPPPPTSGYTSFE